MAYTTINKPADYFNGLAYTGTNTSTSYNNGLDMSTNGGLVWLKSRNAAGDHGLFDSVRGTTKRIRSNTTNAEDTLSGVTSFDSTGFTLGTAYNDTPYTFMSWSWLAGGTASSNTDGSITSSVSANTTAGFSIVSFTGTGANATVGHGLSSAPKMVIFKNRDNGTQEWDTYHAGLTDATYFIQLNSTNAQSNTNGALRFNSTAPTSSVFSVGTATTTNESSSAMIAYCFSEVKGFSKFGSYTGNGSTDGTFIYTGFKPAWVLWKRTDSAINAPWVLMDNKRSVDNPVDKYSFPSQSDSEGTANVKDFLSNGFKFRIVDNTSNVSGASYIYMAFAESPTVTSTGTPTTAR